MSKKLMTEEEVKASTERQIATADRALERGDIDQETYTKLIKDIGAWRDEQKRYV